uniref:Capsid protein n=1 Tax=Antarctic circular DNA molecule TaxID=2664238 RepID=A0A5Q2F4R3_9ZZZZ|nr:capsid protein [Antarctic circular DNA molecule]
MYKRKNTFPSPTYSKFTKRKVPSGLTKSAALNLIAAIKKKKSVSEVKTLDVIVISTAITATPQFFLMNGLNQGSAVFNRIGSKVTFKSFQFRASIDPVAAQANTDVVRILLIYDKSTNKSIPTFADIIQSKDGIGTPTSNIDDMKNIDNTERFKIIFDQSHYLPAVSATPFTVSFNSEYPGTIEQYTKFEHQTQYTGTQPVGTMPVVANITSGAIYMILYSSLPTGYLVTGTARLRFDD